MANDMVTEQGVRMTVGASSSVEETGADVQEDVAKLRDGRWTRATLLEHCLDGVEDNDNVRRRDWIDYVDAVMAAACDGHICVTFENDDVRIVATREAAIALLRTHASRGDAYAWSGGTGKHVAATTFGGKRADGTWRVLDLDLREVQS